MLYRCILNVSLSSKVSPSIFKFMGSVVFICNASCMLYSVVSGAKRVDVVLSGLSVRLFICIHAYISCWFD